MIPRLLVLAVVPLLLLALYPALATWSGPRHIDGNSDPQYLYMMNGLAVAAGSHPGHLDHPGATVHALGAATLLLARAGASSEELVDEMLRDPEKMGRWMGLVLAVLAASLVFASGKLVASAPGLSLWHGVFFQLWPFAFTVVWALVPVVAPDFFLLCLAQLFCALALVLLPGPGAAVTLGILLGLMLVTKVTALLFIAVPVFLFRRNLRWLAASFASAGAVYLFFILLVYRSQTKYFVAYSMNWLWGLATRKGWYGEGASGLPGISTLVANVANLATELHFLFVTAPICLAASVLHYRNRGERRDLWLVMSLIAAGQILLIAKGSAPRYALPALPAASLALLLFSSAIPARSLLKAQALILAAVLIAAGIAFGGARGRLLQQSTLAADALAAVPAGRPVICSGLGSRLDCALHIGNNFSHNLFTEKLKALYPGHYLWVPEAKETLLEYGNTTIPLVHLLRHHEALIFQGHSLERDGKSRLEASIRTGRLHEAEPKHSVWEAGL